VIKTKESRRRAPLLWKKSDLKIKKRIDNLDPKATKKVKRKKFRKTLNDMADLIMSDDLEKQRQGMDGIKYLRVRDYDSRLGITKKKK